MAHLKILHPSKTKDSNLKRFVLQSPIPKPSILNGRTMAGKIQDLNYITLWIPTLLATFDVLVTTSTVTHVQKALPVDKINQISNFVLICEK